MSVAFGPWCIGARTGHCLLILVSYRSHVNTAILRMNAHKFGHPWLHYVDRIDTRITHFHGGRGIYPRHENQSDFQGICNYAAGGIGSLFFEQDYVEKGEPDPRLKGDMRFTAERMLVKCAPDPVKTPPEKKTRHQFHSGRVPKSYRKGLGAACQEVCVLG